MLLVNVPIVPCTEVPVSVPPVIWKDGIDCESVPMFNVPPVMEYGQLGNVPPL